MGAAGIRSSSNECAVTADRIANTWDWDVGEFQHVTGFRVGTLNCRSRASRKLGAMMKKANVSWTMPPRCEQKSMLNGQFGMPRSVLRSVPLEGLKTLYKYVSSSKSFEEGHRKGFELEVNWKFLFTGRSEATRMERYRLCHRRDASNISHPSRGQ